MLDENPFVIATDGPEAEVTAFAQECFVTWAIDARGSSEISFCTPPRALGAPDGDEWCPFSGSGPNHDLVGVFNSPYPAYALALAYSGNLVAVDLRGVGEFNWTTVLDAPNGVPNSAPSALLFRLQSPQQVAEVRVRFVDRARVDAIAIIGQ